MASSDTLRPPSALDPARRAYKDWLHLNVFDHERDRTGLFNVSIHGAPGDPTTQVVTAGLLDRGDAGWSGSVVTSAWADASVAVAGIGTTAGAIAFVDESLVASCRISGADLDVLASPDSAPYDVAWPQAFGSGWIGWRLVPQLTALGRIDDEGSSTGGSASPRRSVRSYHDHNWGRWHWGDDIGWEWGSFLDDAATSVVMARTTDRHRRRCGPWTVILDHQGRRRSFTGRRVSATWSGRAPAPSRRLPGVLAALHPDRRHPRLPGVLEVSARSGADVLRLSFRCRSVAQLILADPVVVGSSFLHEMSGHFTVDGVVGREAFSTTGLAMVEWLS